MSKGSMIYNLHIIVIEECFTCTLFVDIYLWQVASHFCGFRSRCDLREVGVREAGKEGIIVVLIGLL